MTETFEPQSDIAATHLGLVMLPALHNVFQSAGIRVITDEQFQVAAKTIAEALKQAPFPVIVSNKGQSALLRTWTRNVTRLASRVVVVALADGYTEFPEGVTILNSPVSVNEILTAAGCSRSPSLNGLIVNIDGDVVAQSAILDQTTVTAFDDFEELDSGPIPAAPVHEPAPVIPAFEDMADESDSLAVVDEDFAVTDFTFDAPDIPDIPTNVPTHTQTTPVPTHKPVPEQAVLPLLADEDRATSEPEQMVTSTDVVPEVVRAAAAVKPGDWVYEIDQHAHPTEFPPTAVVGAWWSDSSGNVDETSFHPNPHYLPCVAPVIEVAEPVEHVRPAPFSLTVEKPVDDVLEPRVYTPGGSPVGTYNTESIVALDTPATTSSELPKTKDYQPVVEDTVPEYNTMKPDLAEYRLPEGFQDDETPEHVVDSEVADIAPQPVSPERVVPAPVAVANPEPVAPVYVPAPIVIPTITPTAPVAPDVQKASDESLLAAPSNYKPLNEYIEPTSLTSDDNTFSMGRGDDSYLAVRNRPHGKGDVVFAYSGKGGVGKSTVAYSLAQRAATQGKRVVLVDGNFGQGDLRQYLRLTTADIPSVYDAAVSRNLKDAFIGPDTINQYRAAGLDDIKFVYVAAPPPHLADNSVVTPELYAAIIAEATHFADLIFVDTQIIETVDSTGMVDRLVLPLMRERAWGVGISDLSAPGIANTMRRLDTFAEDGVPATRQMTMLNRVPRTGGFNADKLATALGKHSTYIGAVLDDENIHNQMNLGRTVSDSPGLAPLLDTILYRIAGQQPPEVAYASSLPPTKSKRRFFGKNK